MFNFIGIHILYVLGTLMLYTVSVVFEGGLVGTEDSPGRSFCDGDKWQPVDLWMG